MGSNVMTKSIEVASWRVATPNEMADYYRSKSPPGGSRRKAGMLVVRTHLRPVDVYAYLRARFGTPNGLQNFLRKDDSDNWIHWDFNLRAQDIDVYVAGTSRDIHFLVAERMTDEDWKALILAMQADFGRVARDKSEMTRSFEKYLVFQNKFVTLADLCAEMHTAIIEAPAHVPVLPDITSQRSAKRYTAEVERQGKRATDLYGDCLKLRMLTPIMAEAYINMLILMFCKDSVRNDREAYEAFIRMNLPERLAALRENCEGFERPIDQTTIAYRNFKRVMDKRNFAIHGNVDPEREPIETVYFEGRRPLFVDGGDNILKFFDHLEALNTPQIVVSDYEAVHLFLIEIREYLAERHQWFFDQVITDPYPGYDVHKKRVTRLLPNHNVRAVMTPLRYDDQLKVSW